MSKQSVKSIQTPVSPQASSDVEFDLKPCAPVCMATIPLLKPLAAFATRVGCGSSRSNPVSQSDLSWRRKAHDLKGSAANLGLMAYSAAFRIAVDALRRGGVDVAVTQFELEHLTCMNTCKCCCCKLAPDDRGVTNRLRRRAKSGLYLRLCWGSVAQSVEQRTFNPLVASSSLARPTKKF